MLPINKGTESPDPRTINSEHDWSRYCRACTCHQAIMLWLSMHVPNMPLSWLTCESPRFLPSGICSMCVMGVACMAQPISCSYTCQYVLPTVTGRDQTRAYTVCKHGAAFGLYVHVCVGTPMTARHALHGRAHAPVTTWIGSWAHSLLQPTMVARAVTRRQACQWMQVFAD